MVSKKLRRIIQNLDPAFEYLVAAFKIQPRIQESIQDYFSNFSELNKAFLEKKTHCDEAMEEGIWIIKIDLKFHDALIQKLLDCKLLADVSFYIYTKSKRPAPFNLRNKGKGKNKEIRRGNHRR